jgi:hypothetical protein
MGLLLFLFAPAAWSAGLSPAGLVCLADRKGPRFEDRGYKVVAGDKQVGAREKTRGANGFVSGDALQRLPCGKVSRAEREIAELRNSTAADLNKLAT